MHGNLLVDEESALDPIFANGDRLIAVHAEDQNRIRDRRAQFAGSTDPAIHSQIQDNQAALNATQLALKLSKKYAAAAHPAHVYCRRSRTAASREAGLDDSRGYTPTPPAQYQRLRKTRFAVADKLAHTIAS